MTLEKLDNLVKIKKLKREPPDQKEFDGMIVSAKRSLKDANVKGLSVAGSFTLVYGAAHAISIAAMRWHGYRSDNRYLVFQCLKQTVGLEDVKWRILDKCHNARNLAEYEGCLEISPQLVKELIDITKELVELTDSLGPVTEQ